VRPVVIRGWANTVGSLAERDDSSFFFLPKEKLEPQAGSIYVALFLFLMRNLILSLVL
jgi:hypothetical protein